MDFFGIGGIIVNSITSLNDLYKLYKDITSWNEADLEVDRDWLDLAIEKKQLSGNIGEYAWINNDKVATYELKGMYEVALAINIEKKIKYRITQGRRPQVNVLMRKMSIS